LGWVTTLPGSSRFTSYVNHVITHPNAQQAPHAIVPDIHTLNFPTGGRQVNHSGATYAAEAFFEIKTFTGCKSRYNHIRPVDQCAHKVILSYNQKFKKLDCLFAADIVGDGTSEVVGPFEAAKLLERNSNTNLRRLVWRSKQGLQSLI
jgi:hypothetical protein